MLIVPSACKRHIKIAYAHVGAMGQGLSKRRNALHGKDDVVAVLPHMCKHSMTACLAVADLDGMFGLRRVPAHHAPHGPGGHNEQPNAEPGVATRSTFASGRTPARQGAGTSSRASPRGRARVRGLRGVPRRGPTGAPDAGRPESLLRSAIGGVDIPAPAQAARYALRTPCLGSPKPVRFRSMSIRIRPLLTPLSSLAICVHGRQFYWQKSRHFS